MNLSPEIRQRLLTFQRNEITEYHIYRRLAALVGDAANADILNRVANDERRHYEQWRQATGVDVPPQRLRVWLYSWMGRVLGYTFALKLMERGEGDAQVAYDRMRTALPEAAAIMREEGAHEDELLRMLDEERLKYTGSVVLGLNDALVELTGALAGLTLALQNTRLIGMVGAITGIAAALSMAASEYLSTKTEAQARHPLKAAIYTGVTYIVTVLVLIAPYLILPHYLVCLGVTLMLGVGIIAAFNFYVSVVDEVPFRRRFLEMAGLSLGVAALSFLIGFALRQVVGVDVD